MTKKVKTVEKENVEVLVTTEEVKSPEGVAPVVNVKVDVVVKDENPLLKKIQMPGQMFRLPSRGIFYKNGELDKSVQNGEVEIFAMKTIDEITLKTPDMIFQGTAISRVFERCIPLIKKPMKLLSEDVDYLLGCLRQVSYGNMLPLKHTCECTDHKTTREYVIPLNTILTSNTVELDESNVELEYTYELVNEKNDNATQLVQFKPILFEKLVEMYQFRAEQDAIFSNVTEDDLNVDDALKKAIEDYVTMTIASVVESVDGITNRAQILEWCKELPVELKNKLSDKLENQSEWGTKFEYKVKCYDCKKDLDLTASLNPVGFFTLPSRPTNQQ